MWPALVDRRAGPRRLHHLGTGPLQHRVNLRPQALGRKQALVARRHQGRDPELAHGRNVGSAAWRLRQRTPGAAGSSGRRDRLTTATEPRSTSPLSSTGRMAISPRNGTAAASTAVSRRSSRPPDAGSFRCRRGRSSACRDSPWPQPAVAGRFELRSRCHRQRERVLEHLAQVIEGTDVVADTLDQIRRIGDRRGRAEPERVAVGRGTCRALKPIVPLAPSRLVTTTCWPSSSESALATERPITSLLPPAGNGTITSSGRVGQLWALPSDRRQQQRRHRKTAFPRHDVPPARAPGNSATSSCADRGNASRVPMPAELAPISRAEGRRAPSLPASPPGRRRNCRPRSALRMPAISS